MRVIGTLLILTHSVAAQESAAELFYRAFWLENAAGKPDEAMAFYERVLKEHPDAPETPRAILGLVRLKTARGENVDTLLKLLGGLELEAAKRIVAARQGVFDCRVTPADSPVSKKLKLLFVSMVANKSLHATDRSFLVDAGAAAHPMLRALLRSATSYNPINQTAQVLLTQESEAAERILANALLDEDVLFHSAIISAAGVRRIATAALLKAVVAAYDRPTSELQEHVVQAMKRQARFKGAGRNVCYALLIRALENADDGIRAEACRPNYERYADIPDAYLSALLDRMEKGDAVVRDASFRIVMSCANRPVVFERARALVEKQSLETLTTMGQPEHEEQALLIAHAAIAQRTANPAGSQRAARIAASYSTRAAVRLAETGLKTDDRDLFHHSAQVFDAIPAEEAERLRREALDAWYAGRMKAAGLALEKLGLQEKHFEMVLAAAKAHPGAGLPKSVTSSKVFKAFGAARAAQLVPYCKDREQLEVYLRNGLESLRDGPGSNAFLRAIVPKLGPDAVKLLPRVAKVSETGAILAVEKFL
ncbi:MAG: hypothetical protein ACYSUN_10335, partial [Planctomycetota bacterium]